MPHHNLLLRPKQEESEETTSDKTTADVHSLQKDNHNKTESSKDRKDYETNSSKFQYIELPILSPEEKKSCLGIVWTSFIHSFAIYLKEIQRQRLLAQRVVEQTQHDTVDEDECNNIPISMMGVNENRTEMDEITKIDHPFTLIHSSKAYSTKDSQESRINRPKSAYHCEVDQNKYINQSRTPTTLQHPVSHVLNDVQSSTRNITDNAPTIMGDIIMRYERANHLHDSYEQQGLNALMNNSNMSSSSESRRSNIIVPSSIETPINVEGFDQFRALSMLSHVSTDTRCSHDEQNRMGGESS